jgi:hypothetical protein
VSPRLEKIEFANPLQLTRQETPAEEPTSSPEPLKYGDLVVVDYAEKKKVYKWPAIVYFHSDILIADCAIWTYDGQYVGLTP